MLNLAQSTAPEWTRNALAQLDEILLDHAHCEKKAAGAAVKLLFSYPQHRFLQEPLSELAREELSHFEAALAQLDRRGVEFGRQQPSPYGGRLHALVRRNEPERLLDLLLVAALIEARSCERMKLLAEELLESDFELASFYRELLASEARHHQTYLELARKLCPAARVAARLEELAGAEARILTESASIPRLHT